MLKYNGNEKYNSCGICPYGITAYICFDTGIEQKAGTIMKKLFSTLFALFFAMSVMAQHGGGLEWHTDLMKVHEMSMATHKPIFGFFTGSDWCGWCHKLERDVFSKPEFISWAKANVILLELDFPRAKQLPQELQQQNNSLQQAFQVQGYPTIWYFSMTKDATSGKMNINAYGNQGYPSGAQPGKEEVTFLATANEIMAKAKADLNKAGTETTPAPKVADKSKTKTKAKAKK